MPMDVSMRTTRRLLSTVVYEAGGAATLRRFGAPQPHIGTSTGTQQQRMLLCVLPRRADAYDVARRINAVESACARVREDRVRCLYPTN